MILRRLSQGDPIDVGACIVAAHPDDETVGMGARLPNFGDATLIHLTDGAPEDLHDAHRAGYPDAAAYRRARAHELDAALEALNARPRRIQLGLQDGAAAFQLAELSRRLAEALAGCELAFTHAYEGGHPDHDAAAFAVQSACRLLERRNRPSPLRIEFAGYHCAGGERVTGRFWPDPARPPVEPRIRADALRRKRAALRRFASQAAVLAWFAPEREPYRLAPDYRFDEPPPPGHALYDAWGWEMTSLRWRAEAVAALARLEIRA